MKTLVVLLSALIATTAFADDDGFDPGDFVVKISSEHAHNGIIYSGSGELVQYRGQVYVLTSEHVVLHDNDQVEDLVHLDGQASVPATFVMADWGMGLALLKTTAIAVSPKIPDLQKMARTVLPAKGSAAMTIGFPYHATSIVADANGVVETTTHATSFLAEVSNMVEISGAHAEFGMSGGSVIDDNSQIVGILSNEYSDSSGKTVYSIPIALAATWAVKVVSDPTFKPLLFRTSDDMAEPKLVVHTQFMQIRQESCGNAPQPPKSCINIEPARDWVSAPTRPFPGEFMARVTQRFETYRKDPRYYPVVHVPSFRSKDLAQAEQTWVSSGGVMSFVQLIRRDDLQPVAMFQTEGSATGMNLDYDYNRIATALDHAGIQMGSSTEMVESTRVIHDVLQFYESQDGGLWTSRSYPMYFLTKSDFDNLQNSFDLSSEWTAMRRRPEEYKDLIAAIKDYTDFLATIEP